MRSKVLIEFKEKIGEMDSRIRIENNELVLEVLLDCGGPLINHVWEESARFPLNTNGYKQAIITMADSIRSSVDECDYFGQFDEDFLDLELQKAAYGEDR